MSAKAGAEDYRVTLGRIAGVFGVRGWVRVQSYTDPESNILDHAQWTLIGGRAEETVTVVDVQQANRGFRVLLQQSDGRICDDRDRATAWVGREIAVQRSELPDPGPDRHYWVDLVGLDVETVDGKALGVLDSMMDTGANDVMVVRGETQRLIPFIRERFVRSVDIDAGRIVVDWDPDWDLD